MSNLEAVLRARKRVTSVEREILDGCKPEAAVRYADWVIRGRWHEAETIIMQEPESAARYAATVIRHRWEEAEPAIMQSAKAASFYASRVIRDRWIEAEPIICTTEAARYYARDVLAGRWNKEVAGKCSCWLWHFFESECGDRLPDDLQRKMFAEGIKNPQDPWVQKYFKSQK